MSAVRRVTTGNPEADLVLGGGFVENSINLVLGEPGTGKTLFAEQLLFSNAGDGRPVLYLTTLSEPLSKVVTYLQQFRFYDESKLGTSVVYDDLGSTLAREGSEALLSRMKHYIETVGPKIIVIDSFKAIHDLAPSSQHMRALVSNLASLLSAYATTSFLVGEYQAEDVAHYPEFAIADGIVEFARRKRSTSDERFMRVTKLRGSGYLEGLHGIHITDRGVQVYPRLVSPSVPVDYSINTQRVSSGVEGLDEMLHGGLWRASTTLLMGPTGSGKTTIALQFVLAGMAAGEPGLYVNFQENPTQLARVMDGLEPEQKGRDGLHFLYTSAVELQIDKVIVEMFRQIEEHGIRRVVVDAVGDLAMAAGDSQRIHDYLYALIQRFASLGVTAILVMEDIVHGPPGSGAGAGEFTRLSYLCDNFILLEIERAERIRRRISVYKTRASSHDDQVHDLSISGAGVRVE